jgi:hypothetical protein
LNFDILTINSTRKNVAQFFFKFNFLFNSILVFFILIAKPEPEAAVHVPAALQHRPADGPAELELGGQVGIPRTASQPKPHRLAAAGPSEARDRSYKTPFRPKTFAINVHHEILDKWYPPRNNEHKFI